MRFIVYAVLFAALARAQTGDPPLIDIPRVKGIAVDGESRDWKGRGYHVGIVVSANGATRAPADFDPTFRLGWDDRGLLVLCVVRDDSFTEKADKEAFGQGDSIEILFAPRVGAPDLIHATIVPGMGPDASEARYKSNSTMLMAKKNCSKRHGIHQHPHRAAPPRCTGCNFPTGRINLCALSRADISPTRSARWCVSSQRMTGPAARSL